MEKLFCDIAIIGGGPAGLMSAITASQNSLAKIILVEKKESLGKKLLLTGGGRCNFTNAINDRNEFVAVYGKNSGFLFSSFNQFDNKRTIEFFSSLGINAKREDDGKIFPASGNAKTILSALLVKAEQNGVKILKNSGITKINCDDRKIISILVDKDIEIIAKNYILATGGKSYPITGSTGDGYDFAKKIGHVIVNPRPVLSPIKTREKWPTKLQGLSLENVEVSLLGSNSKIKAFGGLIFTHFGISGPVILDISRKIVDIRGNRTLVIDFAPGLNEKELDKEIQTILKKNSTKAISNSLIGLFPSKLILALLNNAEIEKQKQSSQITNKEKDRLIRNIKRTEVSVLNILGFEFATATAGGIDLDGIDSKTMRSKLIDNLFFAGEIIDLCGPCGGFNLQMCWTTGYVAGKNASIGFSTSNI
jgi:predicted Rossmann fold flavoprotein